jgi:hypothetical protein
MQAFEFQYKCQMAWFEKKNKRVLIRNSNLTTFYVQTKLARISFKLPKYIVCYRSGTVSATVTLGVSQLSPLLEISP